MYPRLYKLRVSVKTRKYERERGDKSPHLHGETDVDQEVTAATGNERRCGWWKEDGDLRG